MQMQEQAGYYQWKMIPLTGIIKARDGDVSSGRDKNLLKSFVYATRKKVHR